MVSNRHHPWISEAPKVLQSDSGSTLCSQRSLALWRCTTKRGAFSSTHTSDMPATVDNGN
uniref:SFRICE_022046 n=1 Tax=Spodoptera frugiperda TaxID=7108 RepID=A0A2H1VXX0_SPOFR